MTKKIRIGIINISNPDISFDSIRDNVKILKKNGIELVDYCGDHSSSITRFKLCLQDKNISIVWLLTGGVNIIKINIKELELLCHPTKILIGSSDITHLFMNITKPSLKFCYFTNFLDFLDTHTTQEFAQKVYMFTEESSNILTVLDSHISAFDIDISNYQIIGGHSVISSLFLGCKIQKTTKPLIYFWEHHYSSFESLELFEYWLNVLFMKCREYHITIVLIGNSKIWNSEKNMYYTFDEQISVISSTRYIETYIYFIDQTQLLIPLQ